MSVTFEESMLDFDINFLPSSTTASESALERQRKQINRVKKKTILTSAVINQNAALKKKCAEYREKWEHNEVLLLTSKEECKQACINYQETLEKCTQIEKDLKTERDLNVELGSKYTLSQNQYEGMKSYANQLQILIKNHEAEIDGLKAEKTSKKDNSEDYQKKLTLVEDEKKVLLKHLRLATDIIMGKKKLHKRHKILFQKYNKLEVSDDDSLSDSGSDEPEFLDDAPHSPHSSVFTSCEDSAGDKIEQSIFEPHKSEATIKKDLMKFNEDADSDCSNEVLSEDTGRGSSLAFSEKCLSSPDYFNTDSPMIESSKINKKPTLVDSATSPMRNVATSPRIFDDEMLLSDTNTLFHHEQNSNTKEYFITDETPFSDEIVTIKEKRTLVEAGTSPIRESEWNSSEYIILGDVPLSNEVVTIKEKRSLVEAGTSPIRESERNSSEYIILGDIPLSNEVVTIKEKRTLVEAGTSPIREMEWNSSEYIISSEIPLSNEKFTIKEKRKFVNVGTSPIKDKERVHTANSPLSFGECVEQDKLLSMLVAEDGRICNANDYRQSDISIKKTSCIIFDDTVTGLNGKHTKIDNLASHCELEISDKSIEENNSNNFNDVSISDGEIERILDSMRLEFTPLSPIPASPVKIHGNESENVQEPAQSLSEFCEESEISHEEILREDNKSLRSDLDHLKREVVGFKKQMEQMKSWVKNIINNSSKSNEERLAVSNISEKPEIFDIASQDTIIIYPNDKNSDRSEENELASAIRSFNLSTALRNSESTHLIEAGISECAQNIIQNNSLPTSCIASKSRHVVEVNHCPKNINSIEHESISHTTVPVSKNDSRESITFEEDIISEEQNDIILNAGEDCIVQDLDNCSKYKKRKKTRLSKLEKFKQKLKPKCKISTSASVRKLRSTIKLRPVTVTIAKMDPNVILNNKIAYEYAAKVMAEEKAKAKEKDSSIKKRVARSTKKVADDKKDEGRRNLDNTTSLEQKQQQLKTNQPQRQLRRKSKDQQDSNDKYSEPIEDVDWQNDFLPMTRSRSRKLSNSSNGSSIHEDTTEKDISFSGRKRNTLKRIATDRPIIERKRVLRSSFQGTCIVENEQEAKWSDIPEKNPSKRYHKLSDSGSEEQITSHYDKKDSNVPSKAPNRKLSKTESKEQSTNNIRNASNTPKREGEGNPAKNVINASNIRKNIKDRNPSRSENENENPSDNVKIICKSNIIEERKLFTSQNDKQNLTENVIKDSKMPKYGKKNDRNKTIDADELISHPKNSILCKMLEKHGRGGIKFHKTIPDKTINSVRSRLEESIASIIELPATKAKLAMNKLLDEIQGLEERPFMLGLMHYLKDPNRKNEQFNKVNCPPAPDMTKAEQVLLYIVRQMENLMPNTLNMILSHIEYSLFKLNRTPDFDVIENLSRFYALLCRYFGMKTRLRLFILDAMYCLKYKVIPLIKQCLDVWMHILPLAHMGIAKSTLVTSLVYLLHFYKCEDKYKKRALEIRLILKRKYFYEIPDWNEPMFLEMFRNAIKEVRDIPVEKKMLRMALIILGKRKGPQWCNQNIIKGMLMPMIERNNVPMKTRQFCVQMLGPLLKPFPADMKVHFEIAANYLYEMLDQNPPDAMKEAVFTSLIYIGHHNPNRLICSLLSWMPKKVSPEFEEIMKDYVRIKSLVTWKKILPRISI